MRMGSSRLWVGDGDLGDRVRLAGVTVKWAMCAGTALTLCSRAEIPVEIVPNYRLQSCRNTGWNRAELAARMVVGGRGEPSALAVIVPNGYGHVRGGEVGVIPIGALGP